MSHQHGPVPKAEQSLQERRALTVLIVVLVPLVVWTIAAMVWLWPRNTDQYLTEDAAVVVIEGTTRQTGEITEVTPAACDGQAGSTVGSADCAELVVKLLDGPEVNTEVSVLIPSAVYASGVKTGQQVMLYRLPTGDTPTYQFADFKRTTPLLFFVIMFAVVVVAVARWRGFMSLVGLSFALVILSTFLLPNLLQGRDALMVSLVAGSAIMLVVLYATHGFSTRTTTALLGTMFGLLVAAGLGWWATRWTHLTGVTSEEDYSLAAAAPNLSLTSVVTAGVVIAGLGVLNDVTITQASAVWELASTERNPRRLFARAMRIGRDHIASTVYTIAFATFGATMGTLLLIQVRRRPLMEVLTSEEFSGELVRTLAGSIGLVLAVPLTTAVGVFAVSASRSSERRRERKDADPAEPDATLARAGRPARKGKGRVIEEDDTPRSPGSARRSTAGDKSAFRRSGR